jgi:hypothetical protein
MAGAEANIGSAEEPASQAIMAALFAPVAQPPWCKRSAAKLVCGVFPKGSSLGSVAA